MNKSSPSPAENSGYQWVERSLFSDERGLLSPIELHELPFEVKRIFTISEVPKGTERGKHAHRSARQLLVCVQGQIEVLLKTEAQQHTELLTPQSSGLLVENGVWASQTYLESGSVLMVFSSENFDPDSYVAEPEDNA